MKLLCLLFALLALRPALGQRRMIKVPRCAEADTVPTLRAGYRAYIDQAYYEADNTTSLVVLVKTKARFVARARVDGTTWKGLMPTDLTVFLRNAEVGVVRASGRPIRLAAVVADSVIDLGPALEGRAEFPSELPLQALPLTVILPPDMMLRLINDKKPAIRAGPLDIPVERDVRVALAGLYVTLLCGSPPIK
jgi:hypothetical protein